MKPLLVLLLLFIYPSALAAGEGNAPAPEIKGRYVPGELLVKYRESDGERVRGRMQARSIRPLKRFKRLRIERLRLPASMSVQEGLALLRGDPEIEYVEPNYLRRAQAVPNDPLFGLQWALHNIGQTVNGASGQADADIDAPNAWDIATGGEVIIAVLDTGVAHNHPDLAENMWTNPNEILDGTDSDGNGFVDDLRGWDFVDEDNEPMDPNGHGTFVSGIVAARGNNGMGMAGVCWSARILPLRFLNGFGEGSVADAIEAINYAVSMGARVINASYGSIGFSSAELEAIQDAGEQGVLFVVAAGNRGADTDVSPEYPASYDLDNIISVAATTQTDALALFSNYGKNTVDVGAPGTNLVAPSPRTVELRRFSFEEGAAPDWGLDPPWEVTSERAHLGSFSLGALVEPGELLVDTSAQTPPLDLSGRSGTMLSFVLQRSLSLGTLLFVEAARAGGGPWEIVPVLVGGTLYRGGIFGSSSEWIEGAADLGVLDGAEEAFVRFRLLAPAPISTQEVFLDEVGLQVAGSDQGYSGGPEEFVYVSGTSFSAAVVSGQAGLILSHDPNLSVAEVRARIINHVDRTPRLNGLLVSDGRVNAYSSLGNGPQIAARGENHGGGGCTLGNGTGLPGLEWVLLAAVLLLISAGKRAESSQKGRWKKQRL
jgi:subtilisin family serine protease